mmetsp:Transcript_619/g.540  ORF Transcript_619/g.540 Transcript_619/m.540 type:complete len:330 (-) Transcript_619:207-1196(-)
MSASFAARRNQFNPNQITKHIKRSFSHFEDYHVVSKVYDSNRRLVGGDQLQSTLKSMYSSKYEPATSYYLNNGYTKQYPDFLSELRVLDAGCGTGNYLTYIQDLGIGTITGLELNEGMLNQCKTKAYSSTNNGHNCLLKLYQGSIIEMPFKPKTFDFMMINQVLHHIDDEISRKDDYKNTKTVLSQCYDKLNGDGSVLFITTSYPSQLSKAFWCYSFFDSCYKLINDRYNEYEWWKQNLLKVGFKSVEQHIITETNMKEEVYHDIENIFDKQWRKSDSMFAFVTDEEFKAKEKEIRGIMDNEKEKTLFMEHFENLRQTLGHSVAIVARK